MFRKQSGEGLKIRILNSREAKNRLVYAVLFLVLFGSVFGSIRFLRAVHSPKYRAKKYFSALLDGDVDKAYACLAIPEGNLEAVIYAKETYAQVMLPKEELKKISDYEIYRDEKNPEQEIYVLKYRSRDVKEDKTISVRMEKQKEKQWLIFPKWKVSLDEGLVKTTVVEVPLSATLKINGKEIGMEQMEGERTDYGTKMYNLNLFRAYYIMEIEDELHQVEKKVVQGGQQIYWSADTLKPGVRRTLAVKGADYMKVLLEAAVNINKGVPDIVKMSLAKYGTVGSKIDNSWKVLVNDCNPESKYRLNQVTITNISAEPQLSGNESAKTWIATVPISYNYTYSARTGSKDVEGSGENRAELYLIWDNGEWQLYDFAMNFAEWGEKTRKAEDKKEE